MKCWILVLCVILVFPAVARAASDDEHPVAVLRRELASGTSAETLVRRYLGRIRRLNPQLHAVIVIDPRAIEEARASDARRRAASLRGPLDGIPILIKDNIDVAGLPTTAGSLALIDNVPQRDAWLVDRLRRAGLIVLGKTNLSEWANIRSDHSISGWSAVGGLTRNPYALDRSACGSSAGSAVAVAADLAPLAIGTETDGSITCPAAVNGIVGIKPTVGRISRSGIIPISASQDTAGPLARSIDDAALLLSVLTGTDPADPATAGADAHALAGAWATAEAGHAASAELRGARIGVVRFVKGFTPATLAVFEHALTTLRSRGAVLVDVNDFDTGDLGARELTILLTEFKTGVDAYLRSAPPVVKTRSLEDLIAFDRAEPRELALFGQELFLRAAATDPGQAAYVEAHREAPRRAGADGIDRLLREHQVVALVSPTTGPAWIADPASGSGGGGGPSSARLPAVAGYPHVTVPMGFVAGLPLGLSFFGPAWSEERLMSLAQGFEHAAQARRPPRLRHVGSTSPN